MHSTHVDEEGIERLRHGELAPAAERSVREHIAACTVCFARATAAERDEREVYDALRVMDHPAPLLTAQMIAAKSRARGSRRTRWVGGILTVAVAGVASAAPGSPVRSWLTVLAEPGPVRVEPLELPAEGTAKSPEAAGIAVLPGRALVIAFAPRIMRSAAGQAIVTLGDSAEVVVRAPLGAATFTTDVEQLVIQEWDASATFEILIPRSAERVEIRIGGRRAFLQEGRKVTTFGVLTGPDQYTIALAVRRP